MDIQDDRLVPCNLKDTVDSITDPFNIDGTITRYSIRVAPGSVYPEVRLMAKY